MLDTLLLALILTALVIVIVELCGIRRVLEEKAEPREIETTTFCPWCCSQVSVEFEGDDCPCCSERIPR